MLQCTCRTRADIALFSGQLKAAEKRPGINCSRMRQISHDLWGIRYLCALLVYISATYYCALIAVSTSCRTIPVLSWLRKGCISLHHTLKRRHLDSKEPLESGHYEGGEGGREKMGWEGATCTWRCIYIYMY